MGMAHHESITVVSVRELILLSMFWYDAGLAHHSSNLILHNRCPCWWTGLAFLRATLNFDACFFSLMLSMLRVLDDLCDLIDTIASVRTPSCFVSVVFSICAARSGQKCASHVFFC